MTIEQTTKQWMKMLAARVKRRTLVRYRGIIARHIYPHLDVTVPFEEDGLPAGWSSSWNSSNTGVVTYAPPPSRREGDGVTALSASGGGEYGLCPVRRRFFAPKVCDRADVCYNGCMGNIVWLIVDVASFAIFAIAGVTALARRDDVPTLDKTWAAPDSAETDFSSVRRFAIGAGVAALVYAVVMFAAVPAVLWAADTAASTIAVVVCGGAAVGAVALFFADRICLRAPKDGKTAAKGAESEKDFGKVAKNR